MSEHRNSLGDRSEADDGDNDTGVSQKSGNNQKYKATIIKANKHEAVA